MEEPSYAEFVARLNQAKALADAKVQTASYDDVFSGAVFSIAVKKNTLFMGHHDRVSEARLVGANWQEACFHDKQGSGPDILDWESPRLAQPTDSPDSTSRGASSGSAAPSHTQAGGGAGGSRASLQQQRSLASSRLDSPSRRASMNAYATGAGGRNGSGRISAVLASSLSVGSRRGGGGGSGSSSRASGVGLEAAAAAAIAATSAAAATVGGGGGGMSDDDDDDFLPTRRGNSMAVPAAAAAAAQAPRPDGAASGGRGEGGQLRSAPPSQLVVELPAGEEPPAPAPGSPGMASRADEAIRAFALTAYEPGEVRHSLFLHPGGADPQPRQSHILYDPTERPAAWGGEGGTGGNSGGLPLAPVPRAVPRHVAAAAVALSPTGRQRPASPGMMGVNEASAAMLRSSWQGPLPLAAALPGGATAAATQPSPPPSGEDGHRRPASRGRPLTRSASGLGFVTTAAWPSAAAAGAAGSGGGWPGSPVLLPSHMHGEAGGGGGRPLMTPPPPYSPGAPRRSLPLAHLAVKVGGGGGGGGAAAGTLHEAVRSPEGHGPTAPSMLAPSSPSAAAAAAAATAAAGGGGGAGNIHTSPHPPSPLQPASGSSHAHPHPPHRAPGARALAAGGEGMALHRVSAAGTAATAAIPMLLALPGAGGAAPSPASPGARSARGSSLNGPAAPAGGGGGSAAGSSMRLSASGEGSTGGGLIRGYAGGGGGGGGIFDYRMLDSVPRIGLDGPRLRGGSTSRDAAIAAGVAVAANAAAAARAAAAGHSGAAADSHAEIRRALLAAPPGLAGQRVGFTSSRPGTPSLAAPPGAEAGAAANASPGRFERAKRTSINGGANSMIVTREQVDKYVTGAAPHSGVFSSGGGGAGASALSSPVGGGGGGLKALALGMRGCLTGDPAIIGSPKPRQSLAGNTGAGGSATPDSPRRTRPEASAW
ncbi:hypothetical protein HYH02_004002 [Chlamydomonas schloesseri]|uniref:Uncharacterized protein n=1 Tax=Chlamydomonas schloesseri TaxID=2026947 RepID=A0A836B934_9CHLO|nr:hypothetical protein HYH02_004002 [Chlamydomonas schloesseri]|eukprot:KAG2451402.1 hypothetical protein HYH02_004002 [Chlamydomonas schloesseri]